MVVSGWNKNRQVPEGILNLFGNKLSEKYMQHGSPRCYTIDAVRENILTCAKTLPKT